MKHKNISHHISTIHYRCLHRLSPNSGGIGRGQVPQKMFHVYFAGGSLETLEDGRKAKESQSITFHCISTVCRPVHHASHQAVPFQCFAPAQVTHASSKCLLEEALSATST